MPSKQFLKANQQVQVDYIIARLRKGQDRKAILQQFAKVYNLKIRQFDARLKQATDILRAEHKHIEAEVNRRVKNEIEKRKTKILSALERQEILSQIARGEIPLSKPMVVDRKVKNIPVVPDYMDRKNAINELNKMDGSHTPVKVAQTTTKGEDVLQPVTQIEVVHTKTNEDKSQPPAA